MFRYRKEKFLEAGRGGTARLYGRVFDNKPHYASKQSGLNVQTGRKEKKRKRMAD